MTGKSQSPKPKQDAVAQAAQIVSEATGKTPLNAPDVERANAVGKMTQLARVEFYTEQLRQTQLRLLSETQRRGDWFERDHKRLSAECVELRVKDKELDRIKSTLSRDRWEALVALIATGLGAGLISTFPPGSAKSFFWLSPDVGFALGWAFVALALVWQAIKLAGLSVAEIYRDHIARAPQQVGPTVGQIDVQTSLEVEESSLEGLSLEAIPMRPDE